MKHKKPEQEINKEHQEPDKFGEQMEHLRAENKEILDKLMRLSADYANFQKRVPRQIADTVSYEKETIIKSFIPALDNFEHTLQNAHSAKTTDDLIKAMQILYEQMLDILKAHGVETIKAGGEKFDPSMHEAITQLSNPECEDNVVLEEFKKGYKLNGKIIRPSKVIVNKLPKEEPQPAEQQVPEQAESAEEKIDEYENNKPENEENRDDAE